VDVRAALCAISPTEGHPLVLAAMSEFRVAFGEAYGFDWFIASLNMLEAVNNDEAASEWEWRTSVVSLLNALASSPEVLELSK